MKFFCICRKPDTGSTMILCDNSICSIKWFHIECLNMKKIPRGSWFCEDCVSKRSAN